MRKDARPRLSQLKLLYRQLANPVQGSRLNTLSLALQWYDETLDWCLRRPVRFRIMEANVAKPLKTILKIRALGARSSFPAERETALCTAIRSFEQILGPVVRVPKLDEVLRELEARRTRAEQSKGKSESKYGWVLMLLQGALQPLSSTGGPLVLQVSPVQKHDRELSPMLDSLSYNRATIRVISQRVRREGLLPVVADELLTLTKAAATVNTGGVLEVDSQRQLLATQMLLKNLVEYARGHRVKLVRPFHKKVEGVPAKKRTGHRPFGARAPKVDGLYAEGSAMAVLYRELKSSQWKEKSVLQSLISVGLSSRLDRLRREGVRFGKWKLEESEGKVRMVW